MNTGDIFVRLTTNLLFLKFIDLNEKYFNNELPIPKFQTIHSYKKVGHFSCSYDKNGLFNEKIEVSDFYDYTEWQLEMVLLHEMIHYKLAYDGLDMRASHGKEFVNLASDLSRRSGLDINKELGPDELKLRDGKSKFIQGLRTLF